MNKLTKFLRAILAIVMMLMAALPSLAHDFEVDGIYYNYLDETAKTVEVTCKGSNYFSYDDEYTGSVTIPSSVTYSSTTYSVTSIGSCAFWGCTGLTSITIPNSVTSIGSYAFRECSGLTSITVPNSVTSIGDGAFYDCTGLTSVTIGNSVITIGNNAFSDCTGLTKLTIEDGTEKLSLGYVTSVPSGLFCDCPLKELYLGRSLSYKYLPFPSLSTLKSVTIGNSVTSIDIPFFDCTRLTEVNISDLSAWCKIDFDSFGANPLLYANKLKLNGAEIKDLVIPNDITEIKNYAFNGCSGLTSITIPNSVNEIGNMAFYGCTGLTSITIPNSVTSIGSYAFRDCSGLTSITIPNSVTSIGSYAFRDCTGLTSITIPNSVTTIGYDAFDNTGWYNNQPDGVIYAGNILYNYKGDMPNNSSINIKEGTVSISPKAFYDCTNLNAVTIPNSVTNIGWKAFYNCCLRMIISYNMTPPTCADGTFGGDTNNSYSARLMIPEGSYYTYVIADEWHKFDKIQEIAGVESVEFNNNAIEIARYDIHGHLLTQPTPGINIVKYNDGTTRKEFVK